ncbi:M28 family peptidase [Aquimarina brevivitae]|uniref:PA domain-containing protein n=1 Tax=Aquimarina brevivitae TaxID=323412 RepID=A0A4V2F5N2_9FLAO|nr:M28 family peptidase [Aquimarina brevivitae]RZS93409.1 PA domain-containing protein [Aquimarina brevivitae]
MQHKLITALLFICTVLVYSQTEKEKVIETVTKNKIEGHIYFLASDELKGRETGTAENRIAAQYLANMLRSYGVKPIPNTNSYFQNVLLEKTSAVQRTSFELGDIKLTEIFTVNKKNTSYAGDAIFVNYGLEEDYKGIDVTGKYVVCYIGAPGTTSLQAHFRQTQQKMELAKSKGALGVIEVCSIDQGSASQLKHYLNDASLTLADEKEANSFTYVWVNDPKESINAAFKKDKEQQIKLSIDGVNKRSITSRNVVGYLEGTDPKLKDEYIIYSAHYDHVGVGKPVANDSIYNGARDNAVGTVTVLAAAENIAKYPTKRSSLFILFTGEEKGLLGSKWYVEHPVLPLNQMVYCFNSDNGGYNDTTKATIIGLGRTSAKDDIIAAAKAFDLEAIDDPAPEQGLFDRSDNVHFAAKGVPAPTYSMGFTAFDAEITKYYHQVTDNPDSVDYDYLQKFFRSYVLACRKIADNPKTPFWIAGDKYYEAGQKLYNK